MEKYTYLLNRKGATFRLTALSRGAVYVNTTRSPVNSVFRGSESLLQPSRKPSFLRQHNAIFIRFQRGFYQSSGHGHKLVPRSLRAKMSSNNGNLGGAMPESVEGDGGDDDGAGNDFLNPVGELYFGAAVGNAGHHQSANKCAEDAALSPRK